ncbi:MAG: DsbA family protein [Candidatus Komeilibacteria bacterium]
MKTYNLLKPWYKKWWGILLIALSLLLIAFIISFSVAVYQKVQVLKNGPALDKYQEATISIPEYSPILGDPNSLISIMAFSDFQCPFCKEGMPIIEKVIQDYGGVVSLIYRHFPIAELHPQAYAAAVASTCANEQDKFWQYHDLLFKNQDDLSEDNLFSLARQMNIDMTQFNQCYSSEKYAYQIRKDLADGADSGLQGTPTFFINGQMVSGVLTVDQWHTLLDAFILGIQQAAQQN